MTDSSRVFIQLSAYADLATAEADQLTVRDLHSSDMVGRFETTVITRDQQGQVRAVKSDATARRWASRGLVVGAVLGVMFPPSVLLSAGAGAVLGGLGGKANGLVLKAIPNADLDALGTLIEPGEYALVVVGEESARQAIELARLGPLRTSVKTGHGTYSDLEREVMTALEARAEEAPSS